jgi:site-specific DNA-cytosine methylase
MDYAPVGRAAVSVTVTDLFCGAGGSSLGAEMAGGQLRLGLNHWDRAIETHATNFQHADHDCEDVSSLTTHQIARYPDSDVLLASPECTNHANAKGARRRKPQAASLFDDGPVGDAAQDRSRATMWDVVRFCEQKIIKGRPYKIVIVENIVEVKKWGWNDNGALFNAWLIAMHGLGYRHEIVWLNSMFCPPTPQSRDRIYVVFWRVGMRAPNLRVEPTCWCPTCERLVDGRQVFKNPEKMPYAKYGDQYYYACPRCWKTAVPAVAPASTIIDRAIPCPPIGGREKPLVPNTRERIRRGLARLASRTGEIRVKPKREPEPRTVPLVPVGGAGGPMAVVQAAGHTYETTPGNRTRDARREPLATVQGTLDKGVVVSYSTQGAAKEAGRDPVDTVTNVNKQALVMANTENGVPRPADGEPAQTLRTAGKLALVMANRINDVPRDADLYPSQPVITGGTLGVVEVQRNGGVRPAGGPVHTIRGGGRHHGVVVANYSPGWAREAAESPVGSVTLRDHHALVVPYNRTGRATVAGVDPSGTVDTRARYAVVVPPVADEEAPASPARKTDPSEISDEDLDRCGYRLFVVPEVAGAMGMRFGADGTPYVVKGNQTEMLIQYGGAVTPLAMVLLFGRSLLSLDESGAS